MRILWLTIAGTLVAAVGFELGDNWPYNLGIAVGLLGTTLTIAGAWLQYRQPVRHKVPFEASQWQPGGDDGYELHVPAVKHGRGDGSSVNVYQPIGRASDRERVCQYV